jgi:hypothetical protein
MEALRRVQDERRRPRRWRLRLLAYTEMQSVMRPG